ncbi:MAG: hypothetical protein AAFO82_09795 [Bacteroidota bacterium]
MTLLAIPNEAYKKVEEIPALDRWVKKHRINLLIVDINKEEIVQWIQY